MKKITFIFILLFFAACGKKEENNSTVRKGWKTGKKNNFALNAPLKNEITPVGQKRKYEKHCIVITAKLVSDKKINPQNIIAKIISERYANQLASSSTIYTNNGIVFPPVKKGLKKLRVIVKVDDFTESYSDYFDTLDGTNIIVNVEMIPAVNFRGKVVTSKGIPVTSFKFFAKPRGLYEGRGNPGHIKKNVTADAEGYFEVPGLLPEHYRLTFETDIWRYYSTNVVLYSDEENHIEFVIPEVEYNNVRGIVLYKKSNLPAEGIEIIWRDDEKEIITTTETNGEFNINVPFGEYISTVLEINESGNSKVSYNYYEYSGEQITLYLFEAGSLKGKITTQTGELISGGRVILIPKNKRIISSKASLQMPKDRYEDLSAYVTVSVPSDENGEYFISNLAAPLSYSVRLAEVKEYLLPLDNEMSIKIYPGKTTTNNFMLICKPVVFVKLKDENKKNITNFKLEVKTHAGNYGSSGTYWVNLSDENGWYKFYPHANAEKAKISLKAETVDRRISEVENFTIEAGKEYEIVLNLLESAIPPDVAGFIYTPDGLPYIDGFISASAPGKSENTESDYLGFFSIYRMDVEKGMPIRLNIKYNDIQYITNVVAGDNNIEWYLPVPVYVSGCVYIEDYTTPATNFILKIMNKYNSSKIISKDGCFSLPIKRYDNYKTHYDKLKFSIVVPGYAPVIRELDITNTKKYDLGEIVVMEKLASVSGCVVDHNYKPIGASVTLLQTKNNRDEYFLKLKSNPDDGTFEFNNLLPGTYFVKANSLSYFAKSKRFDLFSNDNYVLPDLVIPDTNVFIKATLK